MKDVANVARKLYEVGLIEQEQAIIDSVKAWQEAFDYVGFSVKFILENEDDEGGECFLKGLDADDARAFMEEIMAKITGRDYNTEIKIIQECLEKYKRERLTRNCY